MLRHKRHAHSNRRSYDCPYCGMLFKTNMEEHIRTHTGEKPYSCRHCCECFAFLNQLKAHLLNSHNESTWLNYYSPTHKRGVHSDGRRSNHCPYCGMLFKRNMEQHIRIHTGEKPYSCRHCCECFAFLNQLKAHLLNSHNESTWLNYYSPKV